MSADGAPAAAPDHLTVDPQHPWLGLASFTEETRGFFYGREEEVAELSRRVQRKLLTVLFGQSGLGKTSILRAGIVPRLRPEGYCPVYVRVDYSPESPTPSEQIKAAIYRETHGSGQWTQPGVAAEGESLWEFLHHRDDVLRDASGRTLIPLLIFDQFEEIFTLAQGDDFGRRRAAQFLEDLADLVENRAPKALEARLDEDDAAGDRFDFARGDYRVLIALREDYLAHLEGVKGIMPSITQNRMRLAPMTGEQALAAVVKPGGRLVTDEVAAAIVRFIAGGAELRNAEVEPSLLSLICRELNSARLAQGRSEISADLLAGSRDTILGEFYERAFADQPAGVRKFVEDAMLTESGFRESLAEERVNKGFAAAGAPADALAKLVDRRLLRVEERLDVRRVELTHDVLCGVVKASRDLRLEREARDEAERRLAAQRQREVATRKALVRARQIAIGCAALAVVALGGAIFGYVSAKRAQLAQVQAHQAREMAETARGEAEKLIVYLLDDFYLELEPVGRLDIVAALSKKAIDYYAALPPELHTAQTDRNRALALVRYGAALRTQNKLDEAGKSLTEAIDVLGKMRSAGDESEATAIGLGLGLGTEARVLDSQNRRADAQEFAQRAADVLKPLMAASTPSVSVLRAYGQTMIYLGFSQMRDDREVEAVATLEEARAAFRRIDGLSLADLPAAAAFTEASAWQVSALQQLGRNDDARRVGDEAAQVAGQVLVQRPGHMGATRARALILDGIAASEADQLRIGSALQMFEGGARDWETIVRIDPSNQIAWNNLVNARMQQAWMLGRLGRESAAAQSWRDALAVEKSVKMSPFLGRTFAFPSSWLTALEADLGNRRAAETALAEAVRFRDMATDGLPQDAFARFLGREFVQLNAAYGIPLAAGDYPTVRKEAEAAVQRIEQRKTGDASETINRDKMLLGNLAVLADAAYNLGDYVAADQVIQRAIDVRKRLPQRTLQDQRDASDELILAALIAARLDRHADAQRIIEPVLKFHRGLHARGNDDVTQGFQLAKALYASAIATPAKATPQLAEAAALIDRMPPEMRRLVSTALWRNWIAAEQKRRG